MSHHALQRVVVRMLFDPAFAQSVYEETDKALSSLDLTEQEKRLLLNADRRAWGYDPLRRKRTLRTLTEEFKVSSTLILSVTRSLASLDAFFSSARFHDSVQQRASMAMAFSNFLEDLYKNNALDMPLLPDVLRLETALARCRRELSRTGESKPPALASAVSEKDRVYLAPANAVGAFQANAVAVMQRVEQYLFEVNLMPAIALCDDAPRLEGLPSVEPKKKIYLLFTPGANGISIVNIEKAEYLTLYEARKKTTIREALARASASGVDKKRAQEIMLEYLEQETLIIEG